MLLRNWNTEYFTLTRITLPHIIKSKYRFIISFIGPVKLKIDVKLLIFSYQLILTFALGAQKNRPIEDGSFEYPQHMF